MGPKTSWSTAEHGGHGFSMAIEVVKMLHSTQDCPWSKPGYVYQAPLKGAQGDVTLTRKDRGCLGGMWADGADPAMLIGQLANDLTL